VGFDITDQLPIRFSAFIDTREKMGIQLDSTSAIHRLKETSKSVRREVWYNIRIEFGVPMKLVWLINICPYS
jgi:hypothetical protein